MEEGVAVRGLPQLVADDALEVEHVDESRFKMNYEEYLTTVKLSSGLHVKPVRGQRRFRHLLEADAKPRLLMAFLLQVRG